MTTDKRIERMPEGAPRTALLLDDHWLKERPSEAEMLSQLMLLASGVATPETFKPQPRVRRRTRPAATFADPLHIFSQVFGLPQQGN
jgi:hypothetical protein